MTRPPKARVVKLGGSLLEFSGLRDRLIAWLEAQSPAPTVLLVGGGWVAEGLRRIDGVQGLGEEAAHWLCIDGMQLTARVVDLLVPEATLVDTWGEVLEAVGESGLEEQEELQGEAVEDDEAGDLIIFQARTWLREEEPDQQGTPLPHGWAVTSDSIAARLAEVLDADELVLLKSADPPGTTEPAALAAAGYVDEHFPTALGERMLRVVNLRSQ